MSELPKLKIQSLFENADKSEVFNIEQAKSRFDYSAGTIVMVEGQVVSSHEGLVQLASMKQYRDKEFLEIRIVPLIGGG